MKPVLVVWEDAQQVDETTWVNRSEAKPPEPCIVTQVGFVLEYDSKGITLCYAHSDHLLSPRDRIPAGMLRSVVELETGKPLPKPKRRR